MVVEVADSGIDWAEPRDLPPDSPGTAVKLPELLAAVHRGGRQDKFFFFSYYYAPGVHVLMADASVRMLKTDGLSSEELRRILQIGGCKEGETGSRVIYNDCETSPNWPNIAALVVWLLSVGTLLTHAVRSRKRLPEALAKAYTMGSGEKRDVRKKDVGCLGCGNADGTQESCHAIADPDRLPARHPGSARRTG